MALALTLALTLTLTLRGYYDRQSGRAELLARQRRRAPRDVATLAHHVRHTGGCLHRRPKVCCLGLRNPDPDPATLALALAKGPGLDLCRCRLRTSSKAMTSSGTKKPSPFVSAAANSCIVSSASAGDNAVSAAVRTNTPPRKRRSSMARRCLIVRLRATTAAGRQPSQPATDAVTQPFV